MRHPGLDEAAEGTERRGKMTELREYTDGEYKADLRKELEENGLYESVNKRLDEINIEISGLSYLSHRYVQEMMCEILALIELR